MRNTIEGDVVILLDNLDDNQLEEIQKIMKSMVINNDQEFLGFEDNTEKQYIFDRYESNQEIVDQGLNDLMKSFSQNVKLVDLYFVHDDSSGSMLDDDYVQDISIVEYSYNANHAHDLNTTRKELLFND